MNGMNAAMSNQASDKASWRDFTAGDRVRTRTGFNGTVVSIWNYQKPGLYRVRLDGYEWESCLQANDLEMIAPRVTNDPVFMAQAALDEKLARARAEGFAMGKEAGFSLGVAAGRKDGAAALRSRIESAMGQP